MTTKAIELRQYGVLEATGAEARAFLHGQLTNDVQHLGNDRARHAGWCSAKGRLLASFLVLPQDDAFLLQLAQDLAPVVAKRLSMFVLRAKVRIEDASARWAQFGIWGEGAEAALSALRLPVPREDFRLERGENAIGIRVGASRYLVIVPSSDRARAAALAPAGAESEWALEEIRAGRPLITQATQDQFVPQMVDFERIGAIDFQKGCYPGQEIVARAHYRGQVKRRMVRVRSSAPLRAGQELYSDDLPGQPSGMVVNAAGGEALAVVPMSALESGAALRAAPQAPPLETLPCPAAA